MKFPGTGQISDVENLHMYIFGGREKVSLEQLSKELKWECSFKRWPFVPPSCKWLIEQGYITEVGNYVFPIKSKEDSLAVSGFKFSFYHHPITNTIPNGSVTLSNVAQAIKGNNYRNVTPQIRAASKQYKSGTITKNDYQQVKADNLDLVTFQGIFKNRAISGLIKPSGFYPIDLDDLEDVHAEQARILSIQDDYFITALVFVSPGGDGLKWILWLSDNGHTYIENYLALREYISAKYNFVIGTGQHDISRACYLCHDPNIFLNPIFQ